MTLHRLNNLGFFPVNGRELVNKQVTEILLSNCYQIIQNKEICKRNAWAPAVAYRHALTINNF